jgi:hypothetical protein
MGRDLDPLPKTRKYTPRQHPGDLDRRFRISELEKPVKHQVNINPKEFLDRLSTKQILDYLKICRGMKI